MGFPAYFRQKKELQELDETDTIKKTIIKSVLPTISGKKELQIVIEYI
jgi:hypothetical protein